SRFSAVDARKNEHARSSNRHCSDPPSRRHRHHHLSPHNLRNSSILRRSLRHSLHLPSRRINERKRVSSESSASLGSSGSSVSLESFASLESSGSSASFGS